MASAVRSQGKPRLFPLQNSETSCTPRFDKKSAGMMELLAELLKSERWNPERQFGAFRIVCLISVFCANCCRALCDH
jgi:hypothetical protein